MVSLNLRSSISAERDGAAEYPLMLLETKLHHIFICTESRKCVLNCELQYSRSRDSGTHYDQIASFYVNIQEMKAKETLSRALL